MSNTPRLSTRREPRVGNCAEESRRLSTDAPDEVRWSDAARAHFRLALCWTEWLSCCWPRQEVLSKVTTFESRKTPTICTQEENRSYRDACANPVGRFGKELSSVFVLMGQTGHCWDVTGLKNQQQQVCSADDQIKTGVKDTGHVGFVVQQPLPTNLVLICFVGRTQPKSNCEQNAPPCAVMHLTSATWGCTTSRIVLNLLILAHSQRERKLLRSPRFKAMLVRFAKRFNIWHEPFLNDQDWALPRSEFPLPSIQSSFPQHLTKGPFPNQCNAERDPELLVRRNYTAAECGVNAHCARLVVTWQSWHWNLWVLSHSQERTFHQPCRSWFKITMIPENLRFCRSEKCRSWGGTGTVCDLLRKKMQWNVCTNPLCACRFAEVTTKNRERTVFTCTFLFLFHRKQGSWLEASVPTERLIEHFLAECLARLSLYGGRYVRARRTQLF